MAGHYPLYDTFLFQAKSLKGDLNTEQKVKLIADIKNMNKSKLPADKTGIENIYLLIRYASKIEKDASVFSAKYKRKSVDFDLDNFTSVLQKMIYCFVQKHLIEMQEDQPTVEIIFE